MTAKSPIRWSWSGVLTSIYDYDLSVVPNTSQDAYAVNQAQDSPSLSVRRSVFCRSAVRFASTP